MGLVAIARLFGVEGNPVKNTSVHRELGHHDLRRGLGETVA
jgi:hypothetical protein